MVSTIKAIETIYKGYRFRSRLEARWAVFFDVLGIKWEYEKEGYDLDGVRYLPDFWLSEQKCHIEIKGDKPTEAEKKTCSLLASETFQDVHLFYGEIEIPTRENWYKNIVSYVWNEYSGGYFFHESEAWYGWAQCPYCLQSAIAYHSYASRLPCKCSCSSHEYLRRNPSREVLLKLCPDLAEKEPLYKNKNYNNSWPEIRNWWDDKCNTFDYAGDTPRLIAAYTAARQARFEHGEKP